MVGEALVVVGPFVDFNAASIESFGAEKSIESGIPIAGGAGRAAGVGGGADVKVLSDRAAAGVTVFLASKGDETAILPPPFLASSSAFFSAASMLKVGSYVPIRSSAVQRVQTCLMFTASDLSNDEFLSSLQRSLAMTVLTFRLNQV